MANTFMLEIVTPDRLFLSEEVDEMTGPAASGEFGILPGHTFYLTTIAPGKLTYKKGKDKVVITIGSGFAEVGPDRVTVLTESVTAA